ncbi:MAG: endonuclease/exonuclease/phosphatase family protein [Verrucomicrobiae bacterium]|nr:endonuclease/exonuclease/phosphatase family protein [Verrucomicrobiae bacterium]
MFDRFLRQLGEILAEDESRCRAIARLSIWFRRGISLLALGWVATLFICILLFRVVGENNLSIAFALYTPRVLLLVPFLLLIPLVLIFHWRLLPVLLIGGLIFIHYGMGWRFAHRPEAAPSKTGESLSVMTYNRGQHMNQSLQPFKEATRPDIIAFQEAAYRAAGYANAVGYEEFVATDSIGEFTLLSRYPIISSSLIEIPDGQRPMQPVARFEIDFSGTRIAIYSVHFLSPRDTLGYYRRGAFLYGILGLPGTPWAEKRRLNQQFWDARVVQAQAFAKIVDEDPLPTIVVGDFNAPSGGFIHGIFRNILTDSHEAAGHGFGYSFPGTTRNPLSRGGPWMRIDYLFCDEHWETNWCITEADRPSQHRAVAAQFQLLPKP